VTQWLLISEDVTKKVVKALVKIIKSTDKDWYDVFWINDVLHEFESSLHITACVPEDFKGGD